jgi:coenzyme Q-binding protein COQ10
MPVFRAMRHVHHSADEMFDLVADVERYHEFVPLCVRNAILSEKLALRLRS